MILEIININHNGNPKESVRIKWLVALKIYGNKPNKFNDVRKTNKTIRKWCITGRLRELVRDAWSFIKDICPDKNIKAGVVVIQ